MAKINTDIDAFDTVSAKIDTVNFFLNGHPGVVVRRDLFQLFFERSGDL